MAAAESKVNTEEDPNKIEDLGKRLSDRLSVTDSSGDSAMESQSALSSAEIRTEPVRRNPTKVDETLVPYAYLALLEPCSVMVPRCQSPKWSTFEWWSHYGSWCEREVSAARNRFQQLLEDLLRRSPDTVKFVIPRDTYEKEISYVENVHRHSMLAASLEMNVFAGIEQNLRQALIDSQIAAYQLLCLCAFPKTALEIRELIDIKWCVSELLGLSSVSVVPKPDMIDADSWCIITTLIIPHVSTRTGELICMAYSTTAVACITGFALMPFRHRSLVIDFLAVVFDKALGPDQLRLTSVLVFAVYYKLYTYAQLESPHREVMSVFRHGGNTMHHLDFLRTLFDSWKMARVGSWEELDAYLKSVEPSSSLWRLLEDITGLVRSVLRLTDFESIFDLSKS